MPFEFLPTETFLFWLGRYETIGRASLAFTASASLQFYCSRGTKKSWANNQHPPSLNLYWKGQNKSFSEGRHGSEDFALWTCVKLRKTSSRFDLTNWFTCALINEHFSGFSLYIAARFLRSPSKELGFFFHLAGTASVISGLFSTAWGSRFWRANVRILCYAGLTSIHPFLSIPCANTHRNPWHAVLLFSHPPASPHTPPSLHLLEGLAELLQEGEVSKSNTALTLACSRGRARAQSSLNTCVRSPGIAGLSSTQPPPLTGPHSSPRLLPLQLVISICEDRRSSRMQKKPSAGMHIYLACWSRGEEFECWPWEWCSIFTLTQRHPHVNTPQRRGWGLPRGYSCLVASSGDLVSEIACHSVLTLLPFF